MTLELARDRVEEDAATTGELLVEGEHFSWTLELPWRQNEVGKSCIPLGTYDVVLSYSARFGREMPRLIGVTGRLGILIHPGNSAFDTEGCILLGLKRDRDLVFESRPAFERFLAWFASCGNRTSLFVRPA